MAADSNQSDASAAVRGLFDDQHFGLDGRSPRSDLSGAFDSRSSSGRPSAMERGQSPHSRTPAQGVAPSTPDHNHSMERSSSLQFALSSHARTPSEAHSIQSTSSSLRQAYDALRGGIFPPGMRELRRREEDLGSDTSHYGEEDGYSFEGEGPFRSSSPHSSHLIGAGGLQQQGSKHNSFDPLDSPSVPERRSSASKVGGEPLSRGSTRGSTKRTSGQSKQEELASKAIASARQKSARSAASQQLQGSSIDSHEGLSPTTPAFPSSATTGGQKTDLSSTTADSDAQKPEMSDLERKLEAEAAADPNRPRTLKEARALAKERARMRMQAKEGSDATMIGDVGSPASITLRQLSITSGKDIPGVEANRADHRHAQVIQTAKGTQEAYGKRPSVATIRPDPMNDMSSLQAAVGEALDDVSFTSDATSTSMAGGAMIPSAGVPGQYSNPETPRTTTMALSSNRYLTVSTDADVESIAPSTQSFDSAPESPFTSAAHIPPYSGTVGIPDLDEDNLADQPPAIQVIHTASSHNPQGSSPYPSQKTGGERAKSFHPYTLPTHQRNTAPNKIARLDVYGKSVAWPAAFDPAAIVEQKRLAPWERARSYAHYCNDLTSIDSGLQVWLTMVQRPAQRQNATKDGGSAANTTPSRKHVRGERTEGSTYAASVRSDATFPMRGDGAKAKELHHHQPGEASIAESPPAGLPANLPYPILANSPGGGLSSPTSATMKGRLQQTRTSQDSTMISGSTDKQNSRNFFSNLGRRSSARRPTQTSISGLSSMATGSPVTLARNRGTSQTSSVTAGMPSSDSSASTIHSPLSPQFSSTQRGAPIVSSPSPTTAMPSTGSTMSLARNGPQGPRALGNLSVSASSPAMAATAPSYFSSLSSIPSTASTQFSPPSPNSSTDRIGLHGVSSGGGIYSIPSDNGIYTSPSSNEPTDYSATTGGATADRRIAPVQAATLPPSSTVKNSLSYGSVREARRPTFPGTLHPPPGFSSSPSSDSHGSAKHSNGGNNAGGPFAQLGLRRGSNTSNAAITPEESDALDKLCDVLPDADRATLLDYLRRANGNDLAAIGDYLQDQSKEASNKLMR